MYIQVKHCDFICIISNTSYRNRTFPLVGIDCVYAFHFVIKHLIVISTHSIPDTGLTAKLPSINKNIHEYMLLLQMQITLIVKHQYNRKIWKCLYLYWLVPYISGVITSKYLQTYILYADEMSVEFNYLFSRFSYNNVHNFPIDRAQAHLASATDLL